MNLNITGLPRYGTPITATPRIIFRDNQFTGWRSGGAIISGACSRDPGNVGAIWDLRPGLLMGKIATVINSLGTVGQYAPSILGVTAGAVAVGATTITCSAAVNTEITRRLGASGVLHLVGPPTANGVVAEEDVNYSTSDGAGNITCTATANAYVAGSFLMSTDGSHSPRTVVPSGWPISMIDSDNVTYIDQPFANLPIAGVLIATNLLPVWPADTGLANWLVSMMDLAGGSGKWIFDTEF